jgi:DNA-directed RNA polymerase specialized sigma24 family protein
MSGSSPDPGGNQAAYEALVGLPGAAAGLLPAHAGFARDAEDVLQEVRRGLQRDDRRRGALNVRPWLYWIARNRSLNHLRRVQPSRT